MAGVPVTDFPAATALAGDELFPAVQSGVDVKVTADQLATFLPVGPPGPPGPPGAGDVTGPASSTLNGIALFAGTTGKVIKNSAAVGTLAYLSSINNSNWSGTALAATNGGTGLTSGTSGGVLYFSSTTAIASSALLTNHALVLGGGAGAAPVALGSLGTTTTVLHGNASGNPTFGAVVLSTDVSGTLTVSNGGTGITSYAVGDLIYGTGATTLGKLAGVATGNVLLSGGVTTAPAWGKVDLTTHVSGILPIANGGTGATTLTIHGVLLGNTTSAIQATSAGTVGQALISGGASADPAFGTLGVAGGGTGVVTLTGIVKAAGTAAFAAATPGTDYIAPGTATTFTALQTFTGTSSNLGAVFASLAEVITIVASGATGTINFDCATQSVLFYSSNASANWTLNFRGSAGTTLNTLLAATNTLTVAFMASNGGTPYYPNVIQVDGSTTTPKWQSGIAPAAGHASSYDVYLFTFVKTGSPGWVLFASQTQFA